MCKTGGDVLISPMVRQPGRIVVVGTSGSGKTTLARRLGNILEVPHIELDSLYWNANWTSTPLAVFRERVALALDGESWVIDGNYSSVLDLTWGCADTIVWLDYRFVVILGRLLQRTLSRILFGKELWNSNRETWNRVFGRDSIIAWMFKTYSRNKRRYMARMKDPAYAHLQFVRLISPQAARAWMFGLQSG